jgi:predicted DNA-binding mobile mystery protein A
MNRKSLLIRQLENKMQAYIAAQKVATPPTGWIKAIRLAIGMSMEQLGKKLSITRQSIQAMEQREQEGSITIRSLREAADALDMQLRYAFIPKDASLDALIDRKARQLAKEIVMRTSNTMKLEDQEVSKERIEKAIEERAETIKTKMLKTLWD